MGCAHNSYEIRTRACTYYTGVSRAMFFRRKHISKVIILYQYIIINTSIISRNLYCYLLFVMHKTIQKYLLNTVLEQ